MLAPFFLDARFRGSYSLVFGLTLNAICLSLILLYVVRVPGSAAGRLLNTAVLRHLDGQPLRTIVSFLLGTGCRRGEAQRRAGG